MHSKQVVANKNMEPYKVLQPLARLNNKWVTLIGERVEDENGKLLDYWRVERPDSVIVIPIFNEKILLPRAYYRHGIGDLTHDFPGGRIDGNDTTSAQAAGRVLERELKINKNDVQSLKPINIEGWILDSSFSNQRVYAFEAILQNEVALGKDLIFTWEPATSEGVFKIMKLLHCLQCRHALLEWFILRDREIRA